MPSPARVTLSPTQTYTLACWQLDAPLFMRALHEPPHATQIDVTVAQLVRQLVAPVIETF